MVFCPLPNPADDTSSCTKVLDTQTVLKKPLDVVPKDELEWDDISFDSVSRNGENSPPQSPDTSLEDPRPTTLSVSEDSEGLLKKTKSPRRRNALFAVCYKVSFTSMALVTFFFVLSSRKPLTKETMLVVHTLQEPSLKVKLRQGDPNTFGETRRSRKPSKRVALKEINGKREESMQVSNDR